MSSAPGILRTDSAMADEASKILAAALKGDRRSPARGSFRFSEEQHGALLEALLSPDRGRPSLLGLGEAVVDVGLDYTDSWPSVEVSVGINEVLRVDVQDLTFDADFVVYLDWLDPKLRRGDHYVYNAEHGKFEFLRSLRNCKDDLQFFNPMISVANSKQYVEAVDQLPQVFDEVLREGCDVPWMTKKFHFVGTLTCRGGNAKYYPFDLEDLQIRIVGCEMAGLTSLGQDRRIQLVEPVLRRQWRHRRKDDFTWVRARQEEEGISHMWNSSDLDDNNGLGVGEMAVMAFGGVSIDEGQEYALHIVFCRQCYPRHVFDFLILNLQVCAAVTSLYVPFSVDMLANRMSITLTVMLTLVSSASARPPAIESLPYSTLHDTYGQFTLCCVAMIGLGNLIVFQNCWGMYRTSGVDDVFDTSLRMVVNNISGGLLGDWVCEPGICGASNIDCLILYASFAFLCVTVSMVIMTSQMHRISALLKIKNEVDGNDRNPGRYSRLVLFSRGFSLFARRDIISCAAHVALLPCVSLFLKAWRCLRRLRHCCCGCWSREKGGVHSSAQDHLFNDRMGSSPERAKKLPQISRFNVKLAPHELFRVLDVGSGEMGFYSYWLDEASGSICSSGTEAKLKYNKSQTFVNQFLGSSTGPEELAQQIIQRFELSPVLPTTSPPRTPLPSSNTGGFTPSRHGHAGEMPLEVSTMVESLQDIAPTPTIREAASRELPLPGMPAVPDAESASAIVSPERTDPRDNRKNPVVFQASLKQKALNGTWRSGAKKKLILCITGANRQMLRDDVDGRASLQAFLRGVNERVEKFGAECIVYSPEDVDEAMYELWATEWVVQHGDLDVENVALEKAYRNLQGGREEGLTTLQEVMGEFRDLRADEELRIAYCRAATYCRAAQSQQQQQQQQQQQEEEQQQIGEGMLTLPASVPCCAFYSSFEASPPLLRALLRARLFSGTLSAGSGSSQVTLRSRQGLDSSQVHSIPLGNRTPLVSLNITECGDGSSPFSMSMPRTCSLATELLCDDADGRRLSKHAPPKETRPAWPEDGPVDANRLELWRELIQTCAEERGLPAQQRGLYVGISALFYAAKLADCAGEVLPRDLFLARLRAKRDELLADGRKGGRDLANLTLVMTIVEFVLHRTAIIVCKRSWSVGELGAQADFVATWTLGMYLKHSGAMGGSPGA